MSKTAEAKPLPIMTHPGLEIVWSTNAHNQVVQAIDEATSFPVWDAEKWADRRRIATFSTMIAEIEGVPVGFVSYYRSPKAYEIARLSVVSEYRRNGIGTALVNWVVRAAVTAGTQIEVIAHVWDRHLPAQLLFKKIGFKAPDHGAVIENYFKPQNETAYKMGFDLLEARKKLG